MSSAEMAIGYVYLVLIIFNNNKFLLLEKCNTVSLYTNKEVHTGNQLSKSNTDWLATQYTNPYKNNIIKL